MPTFVSFTMTVARKPVRSSQARILSALASVEQSSVTISSKSRNVCDATESSACSMNSSWLYEVRRTLTSGPSVITSPRRNRNVCVASPVAHGFGRVADDDVTGRDVSNDDRARADHRVRSDRHLRGDDGTGADERAAPDRHVAGEDATRPDRGEVLDHAVVTDRRRAVD